MKELSLKNISKKIALINKYLKYMRFHDTNKYKPILSAFPSRIYIENTNYCNANCIMCPRDKMTRKPGFMSFGLYHKLIKEIAKHKHEVERLHLHNFGEPLLDNQLPDKIKLAKSHGITHTYIVTNGSLLTSTMSKRIIKSGLDEIKISFYGIDAPSYNSTMKNLNFNDTLKNIKEFISVRKKMRADKPMLIFQFIPQLAKKATANKFRALFSRHIDKKIGDRLNFYWLHNFGGGKTYNRFYHGITSICSFPWNTFVVLYTGDVTTCCLDYDGKQIMGNVRENSIKSVWNGKKLVNARNDFNNLRIEKYPCCSKCENTHARINNSLYIS